MAFFSTHADSKDRRSTWVAAFLFMALPSLAWSAETVLIGTPDVSINPLSASYDGTLFTATGAPDNLKTDAQPINGIGNSSFDASFGVSAGGVVDSDLGGIDVGGTLYDLVVRGAIGFPPPPATDLLLADVVSFDRIAGDGGTIVFAVVTRGGQFVDDGTYTLGQSLGFIVNIPYGSTVWTGAQFTDLAGSADIAPYQFVEVVSAPGSALLMLLAGVGLVRRANRGGIKIS